MFEAFHRRSATFWLVCAALWVAIAAGAAFGITYYKSARSEAPSSQSAAIEAEVAQTERQASLSKEMLRQFSEISGRQNNVAILSNLTRSLSAPTDANSRAIREYEKRCSEMFPGKELSSTLKECLDAGALLEGLPQGRYRFNKPEQVYQGEEFTFHLVLETDAKVNVVPELSGPGKVAEREGKFHRRMEARLRGADFKISPADVQRVTLTPQMPVEWQWSVTPLKAGLQKTLFIEVFADHENSPIPISVLREKINVEVTTLQKIWSVVGDYWAMIIGAFSATGSVFGAVNGYATFKDRRNKNKSKRARKTA